MDNYIVGSSTMGLREANHPVFVTIIYDLLGIFYSKKTALQLLNEACLLIGGADYRGKIKAIQHNFRYLRKTPLVINYHDKVYAFPTKSPTHYDCRWVFPIHIDNVIYKDGEMYVVFKNGLLFPINCSEYTFKRQLKRTANCFLHYNNPPVNYNI